MWARHYNECKMCNETSNKHHSKGFCVKCYTKHRYKTDPKYRKMHDKAVSKWFSNNREKRLATMKEYNKKYKLNK